jgi:hypothetical protein
MALKAHPKGLKGVYEDNLPRVAGERVDVRKNKRYENELGSGGECRCFTGCPPRGIPVVVSLGEETPRSGTRRCKEHKI